MLLGIDFGTFGDLILELLKIDGTWLIFVEDIPHRVDLFVVYFRCYVVYEIGEFLIVDFIRMILVEDLEELEYI